MNKKKRYIVEDVLKGCKECRIGSCCYEGAELSLKELKEILKSKPKVPKPWFRLVEKHEEPEKEYPFTTIVRGTSCVFQDKNNLCAIYDIRPRNCREFPLENKGLAKYFKRLCRQCYNEWPNNVVKRSFSQRENK